MTVHAPFRFARIPRFVYMPDWAEFISHDVPFADGVSGEVDIEIRTETPLLVGGRRRKATDKRRGEVWPFEIIKDGKGQYAIPPSSLQGMVRSILEIATFGRLGSFVDDRRFGIRELTPKAAPFYQDRLIHGPRDNLRPQVKAGWLRYTLQGFEFKKRELARVEYDLLENHTGIPTHGQRLARRGTPAQFDEFKKAVDILEAQSAKNRKKNLHDRRYEWSGEHAFGAWPRRSSAEQRYSWVTDKARLQAKCLVDIPRPHPHKRGIRINYRKVSAIIGADQPLPVGGQGAELGDLVLTGVAMGPGKQSSSVKHMEFFFYGNSQVVQLAPAFFGEQFRDFIAVHNPGRLGAFLKDRQTAMDEILFPRTQDADANSSWEFFRDFGYPGPSNTEGAFRNGGWMPIFYIGDDTKAVPTIEAFGLAFMFKLAHKNSTHEMLENSCLDHRPTEFGKQVRLDLPSAIFGAIADLDKTEARGAGLKRRAAFDVAVVTNAPAIVGNWAIRNGRREERPLVLATPKPSYYPSYVRQFENDSNQDELGEKQAYSTYTPLPDKKRARGVQITSSNVCPELAGVKIWPSAVMPRDLNEPRLQHSIGTGLPTLDPTVLNNKSVQVVLNAVDATAVFSTKLRFHNLRRIELGAILWALTFGDQKALKGDWGLYRHRIGMGKPLGMGQISIRVAGLRVQGAATTEAAGKAANEADSFAADFEEHMQSVFLQQAPEPKPADWAWKKSTQVLALRQAASIEHNARENLLYMVLSVDRPENNAFSRAKGRNATDSRQGEPSKFLPAYVLNGHEIRKK